MVEDLLREISPDGQAELLDQRKGKIMTGWKPPRTGWLKVNTNAAFKNGLAAPAMVVRDDYGGMVLTMTKLIGCKNAWCAEFPAVNWATRITEQKGWTKVLWSSDAKGIIETINSLEELDAWETSSNIMQIRERCASFSWQLLWNPRLANQATNSIANFSLTNNADFLFNCSDFYLLP